MASLSEKQFHHGLDTANPNTQLPRTHHLRRRGLKDIVILPTIAVLIGVWLLVRHYTNEAHYDFQNALHEQTDELYTSQDICMTPDCVHASSELLYNLSPDFEDMDACHDFEELVCGGWKDRHDLRPDQGDAFTGTIMAENSQTLLRHILEDPYPEFSNHSYFSPMRLVAAAKTPDEANFDKMKAAYDACMDESTISKIGATNLHALILGLRAAFILPLTHYAIESKSVEAAIAFLYDHGVTALIAPYTTADDKDPDTVVVGITPPQRFGLPAQELYDDEKILGKYKTVISDVFANLSISSFPSESVGEQIATFEKKLAKAAPAPEDAYDVTKSYNPMTLVEASRMLPQVGLVGLVNSLAPEKVKVERVINNSPSYMKKTNATLKETEPSVLLNYMIWKLIQAYAQYVESDALIPYKRFLNELSGREPDANPERWRTCVRHVDDGLSWILSRFFVEKAFSEKAKDFGDQMISDIKTQFAEKLRATKWMEPKVRNRAIDKVHNIRQKVGYPTQSPNIMDPSTLEEYYKSLSVDSTKFFQNTVGMKKFEIRNMWSDLGKPVDREKWDMSAPTVNAYYNPPGNEIVFPAGIMQFPVFDVNVPQYLSYGAFASVAGHELSHAFDSTGRHYDQNGNYTDWWTNDTVSEFKKRADCFVNQYANYSIPGSDGRPLHVNGNLTLGENIADAGGVSAAFKAWKLREKENAEANKMLPGMQGKFTKEQLFFVSYANWWCGKSTDAFARQRIYTDPHAPKWARILGTMANSREFLEAFGCKSREPVCELW